MNGFINCCKPTGMTSSDVVSKIKRLFKGVKTGHMGTLDPGAAGVLPIALGKATRLFDFLTDKKKLYRGRFTFGVTTDTLDSYGKVLEREGRIPTQEEIKKVLYELTGRISQIPPAYSALSIGGVRAYDLARKNLEIELPTREVDVFSFELLHQTAEDTFEFDILCGGGTYIRSLARDLALKCGTVGYMSSLIRLSSGVFDIKESFTLEEIEGNLEKSVLPIETVLDGLYRYDVPEKMVSKVLNGVHIPIEEEIDGLFTVYTGEKLTGLAERREGKLYIKCFLME